MNEIDKGGSPGNGDSAKNRTARLLFAAAIALIALCAFFIFAATSRSATKSETDKKAVQEEAAQPRTEQSPSLPGDNVEPEAEIVREPQKPAKSGIRLNRGDFHASTSKEIAPGVWNANLSEGMAYADAHHLPLVAIQGGAFCPHCRRLRDAASKDDFTKWAKERGLVLVYGERTREFRPLMRPGKLNQSPKVAVYWNRGDGSVTTNYFAGTTESMPAARKKNETLGQQFRAAIESFIGPSPDGGKGR